MINLRKEIEKLRDSVKDIPSLYVEGGVDAINEVLSILDQYNIITAPKTIKLSEIVEKLKNNYSYDDIMIFRNSTYTRIVGRMQHHLYSSTEPLFDINFNNVLNKPNFNYKWLYTLWIAGTEIIDDMENDE